jgi:uncharacterized protein YgiM (DUF1202 family)
MTRFVLLSFAFLGWAFYEVSGGSDFEPQTPGRLMVAEAATTQPAPETAETTAPIVTAALLTTEETVTQSPASLDVPTTRRDTGPAEVRPALVSMPMPTPATERVRISPSPSAPTEATLGTSAIEQEQVADLRSVRGSRVNMRSGPGTSYGVIGSLVRGDRVEVLRDPGSGWVKLKVEETGRIGWMSARLLTKVE